MVGLLRLFIRIVFRLFIRLEVQGEEHVPDTGGCLIAINHLSIIDAPLVFVMLKRPKVTAIVADTYQDKLFFRIILKPVGAIWINRAGADLGALRAARDHLKDGWAIGISPEGTRSHTGGLIPAKTGVAYLAGQAGAPVIPVAIWGSERIFHELRRLRRPRVHIHFGPALHLPAVERQAREAGLQRNTDAVMLQIAAMLPPEYRGVYANHPGLAAMPVVETPAEVHTALP